MVTPGTATDRRIRMLLSNHNLDNKYYDKVEGILEIESKYGIPHNPALFQTTVLDYACFPKRGTHNLAGLVACWQRPYKDADLTALRLSSQTAGIVASLKKRGYVWGKHNNQQNQFVIDSDGDECRMIVGVNPKVVAIYRCASAVGSCSDKNLNLFKSSGDIYDGEKKPKSLQIGHNTPISACVLMGIEHPQLSDDMVETGKAHIFFRPEGLPTNYKKREVCRRCNRGLPIEIPPIMPKAAYKSVYDGTCRGCYWATPESPQYPDKFTLTEFRKTLVENLEEGIPAHLKGKVPQERFWEVEAWDELQDEIKREKEQIK